MKKSNRVARPSALWAMALMAAAGAGCGELLKVNTEGGNCDLSGAAACLDFADTSADGNANAAYCTELSTAFGSSSLSFTAGTGNDCSTANVLGSCAVTQGTLRYYSGSQWTASSAESHCTTTMSGTWTSS